tara:strand:+ start:2349 stop:3269 length:921 start_codon:yes stop_codon:yes gene_type:complete
MSGGGGGSSTTSLKEMPEWAKPYWTSIARRGLRESNQPLEQYDGQRISPFSGAEKQAFTGMQNLYSQGDPSELDWAGGQLGRASQTFSNPGQWSQQAFDQYSNPYTQNVLDVQKDRLSKDYNSAMARSRRNIPSSFAQAGTMGGRASLMGAMEAGNISDAYFQNVKEMETQGLASAYNSAMGAYQNDRDARMRGAENLTTAANSAAKLGAERQRLSIERIGGLQEVGTNQREMNDAALQLAYEDFLESRNYGRENLNWLTGLLSGTPFNQVDSYSTTNERTQGASPISQGIGLGIAGLGAYKAYRG